MAVKGVMLGASRERRETWRTYNQSRAETGPSRDFEAVEFKTAEELAVERFGAEGAKLLWAHPDIADKIASEHIRRIVHGL